MIDFSKTCIITGSTDNLNTSMVMSLEDEEYKIAISTEAEDDATPKVIRVALKQKIEDKAKELENKKERLKELIEIAKELGYELTPIGQARPAAKPQSQLKRVMVEAPDLSDAPIIEQGGAKFVVQKNNRAKTSKPQHGLSQEEAANSLELAKRKTQSGARRATSGEASRYNSYNLPESVQTKSGQSVQRPEIFAKKNQVVKGRLGIPTTIPRTLTGSDGTTEIEIVDTGGNEALKRRMSMLNEARANQEASGVTGPDDILSPCASCDGVGRVKNKTCIRCAGVGYHGYV